MKQSLTQGSKAPIINQIQLGLRKISRACNFYLYHQLLFVPGGVVSLQFKVFLYTTGILLPYFTRGLTGCNEIIYPQNACRNKEWNNFIFNFIAVTTLEFQVNPNVYFFIRLTFKCCMKLLLILVINCSLWFVIQGISAFR